VNISLIVQHTVTLAGLMLAMIPNLSVRFYRSTLKLRLSAIADVADINDGAGIESSRRRVESTNATGKSTAGVASTSISLGMLVMHVGIGAAAKIGSAAMTVVAAAASDAITVGEPTAGMGGPMQVITSILL
jgi:hypothetical protein